ncbi:MAG: DinB family protein [Sphingomonadales bacterium]
MSRPLPTDCSHFYHHYIEFTEVEEATLLPAFYGSQIATFFSSLPIAKGTYAYAPEKWTLNQVLQHLLDVERVFVFRLLWIVRADGQPLPGFDENRFAEMAPANNRTMTDLVQEWLLIRESTNRFVSSLREEDLERKGIVDGSSITANALCYITYGHILHHMSVIRGRYLP